MSSAVCHVDRLCALTAAHLNDSLVTLDLTYASQLAGFAAAICISCLCARFTVQGVEGRTCGLGLLGDKLTIDILTSILHTLVIRWCISLIDRNDMGCVVRCSENTALPDTLSTALARYSLIFIAFRAVCVADNRCAGNDVQLGDWIHPGATVTLLTGPRFERLI